MRVLLVTRPGVGGAARHVLDLVTGLAGEHEILALASPLEDPAFLDRLAAAGAAVTAVPMRRGPHFRTDVAAVRAVRRTVRNFRPDVIHAHAFKAGAVARLGARGTPVVYSPHGFYHLYPTAPAPARKVARMVERRLAKRTAVLALCAEWERPEAFGPEGGVVVVPNGVPVPVPMDPARRAGIRESLDVGPHEVLVTMVGRLAPPKRPDLFVDAALSAPAGLRFLLVGDGPDLEKYRDLADGRASPIVAGWRDDLPDLLGATDIAVLATDFEAAPYFLLQAMAAGLPCVATDLSSTREVLGDAGVRVEPIAASLRLSVEALAADPARRETLGAAAHGRVRESFSPEAMRSAVLRAWELARGSRPPGR
ncbi:MAG: glycosyltransferase [Planctomycetota bacterium]